MDFTIVKAGWMLRQSSILKRWKKNWFSLSVDGMFRYFNSPDDNMAEEAYEISSDLNMIRSGNQISGVSLPEGHGQNCLLELLLDDDNLVLCAESPDDASAWRLALEQARSQPDIPHNASAPPPYSERAQQSVVYTHPDSYMQYGTHPPPYVVHQHAGVPGQQTVVYVHDQRRQCDGGDLAVGMLAGATMGTLMWGPLLWW